MAKTERQELKRQYKQAMNHFDTFRCGITGVLVRIGEVEPSIREDVVKVDNTLDSFRNTIELWVNEHI